MNITMAFDPASIAKLERMLHFEFGTTYTPVMNDSLELLQNYAVDFMYANFMNAQGTLESAFVQTITPGMDEITGELANPESYANRREYGFSNRSDSLGRYFAVDEGIAYMETTLANNEQAVFDLFVEATKLKLATLGIL